ncbi:MAG: HEAT repeat domain-containing protein [Proteobacteria bacterium]|nr:HEAT repeat domain-containing protein [Pseudomonadota bacterium]
MKSFSLPVLAACSGASFVIGFGIAWFVQTPDPATLAAIAPQSSPAHPSVGQNQYANVWNGNQAAATNKQPETPAPTGLLLDDQKLREQAMHDPAALRNLIQRYDTERDQNTKDTLKAIIATIPLPEARAFVAKLASSTDASQRREAYELLKQSSPNSPEVRNMLKQALATEQSPAALAQAVAALRPVVVDPTESAAIIGQLRGLTQNADPQVRSQSVLQLAQWDKTGANQDTLTAALNDASPEVRQTAIFAIGQSATRSDSAKTALLAIATNPSESKEIKGSALQVLERFSLSKDEYAAYTKARSQFGF